MYFSNDEYNRFHIQAAALSIDNYPFDCMPPGFHGTQSKIGYQGNGGQGSKTSRKRKLTFDQVVEIAIVPAKLECSEGLYWSDVELLCIKQDAVQEVQNFTRTLTEKVTVKDAIKLLYQPYFDSIENCQHNVISLRPSGNDYRDEMNNKNYHNTLTFTQQKYIISN